MISFGLTHLTCTVVKTKHFCEKMTKIHSMTFITNQSPLKPAVPTLFKKDPQLCSLCSKSATAQFTLFKKNIHYCVHFVSKSPQLWSLCFKSSTAVEAPGQWSSVDSVDRQSLSALSFSLSTHDLPIERYQHHKKQRRKSAAIVAIY